MISDISTFARSLEISYKSPRIQAGPSPILITRATNVSSTSPTLPVTSQQPGVGKISTLGWNLSSSVVDTKLLSALDVASNRLPSITSVSLTLEMSKIPKQSWPTAFHHTRSNHPPAKPGAFNCEPLKAA
jgi:hypothetical protein